MDHVDTSLPPSHLQRCSLPRLRHRITTGRWNMRAGPRLRVNVPVVAVQDCISACWADGCSPASGPAQLGETHISSINIISCCQKGNSLPGGGNTRQPYPAISLLSWVAAITACHDEVLMLPLTSFSRFHHSSSICKRNTVYDSRFYCPWSLPMIRLSLSFQG